MIQTKSRLTTLVRYLRHRKGICVSVLIGIMMTLSLNAHAARVGGPSVLEKEPIFVLRFDVSGCQYDVRINDVNYIPGVMSDPEGIPLVSDVPVTQWMISGKNTVGIKVGPVKDAEHLSKQRAKCDIKIALRVKQHGANASSYQTISQINYIVDINNISNKYPFFKGTTSAGRYNSHKQFVADKAGDVSVSELQITPIDMDYGQGLHIQQTIDMPINIPRWAWLDGDIIENNQATHDSLFKEYKKIWTALHNNDVDSIAPLFEQRTKEYSEAFHVEPSQVTPIKSLKENIDDKNKELMPCEFSDQHLVVLANKKLAHLTSWDGGTTIYFNTDKDGGMSTNYEIFYYRKNGHWYIAR